MWPALLFVAGCHLTPPQQWCFARGLPCKSPQARGSQRPKRAEGVAGRRRHLGTGHLEVEGLELLQLARGRRGWEWTGSGRNLKAFATLEWRKSAETKTKRQKTERPEKVKQEIYFKKRRRRRRSNTSLKNLLQGMTTV